MRIYYDDRQVRITSKSIYVDDRCYRLDEFEQVWRNGGRLAHGRILLGVGMLLFAVTARLAASYTWWIGGLRRQIERWLSGGVWDVALVGAIGLGVALIGVVAVEAALRAIEDIQGNRRHLELWASMSGRPVLLWSTTDALRYGRVCRALVRARGDLPVGGRG